MEGRCLHCLREEETSERPSAASSASVGGPSSRVGEGLVVEGIVHDGLINGGAGDAREGCEGAVGKMATIPKVDRGSITMIENEHTTVDVDEGKGVEVGSRVNER